MTRRTEHELRRTAPAVAVRLRAGRSAYAILIGVLKTLLPSFAIGMVLLIFAWPQINVESEHFRLGVPELAADYADSLSMLNARFDGVDEEGRPFSLSADEASQPSSVNEIVDLSLPKGDITLKDGTWLALTAKTGKYDRQGNTLDLEGAVSLFHDQGFELLTETAEVDLEVGRAEGSDPVTGQGPFGQLLSEGFRVEDDGDTIVFTGRSRMVLYPDR
ncbi:MAG: LPS export ABC transporter periplasmic protein LptC [Kiloniellales bacterium]|nr:LPS export ABC transporter periplasmic protein LptC [Kiloniellales bacterium]